MALRFAMVLSPPDRGVHRPCRPPFNWVSQCWEPCRTRPAAIAAPAPDSQSNSHCALPHQGIFYEEAKEKPIVS